MTFNLISYKIFKIQKFTKSIYNYSIRRVLVVTPENTLSNICALKSTPDFSYNLLLFSSILKYNVNINIYFELFFVKGDI